jgi:hypothetical protein
VTAQPALLDILAQDIEFKLDWDAYRNDESTLSIGLCNIGTCELFVSSNPNFESFVAFVDGYVVFASGYGDLRAVNRRSDGRIAPIPYIEKRLTEMVAREIVTPSCGSTVTPETISCSLNALATLLQIDKHSVRYSQGRQQQGDAGWRTRQLSAEAIARNLSWYAEFGWTTQPRSETE